MADHYGTVDGVKRRTAIRPEHIGVESTGDVDEFLTELLTEATDLMNRRIRREINWNDEAEIPAGLHGIANDIVAASVRDAIHSRETPIQKIDDFAVRTLTARVFSPDVVERLKLYGARAIGTIDVTPGDLARDSIGQVFAHDLDTMDLDA